MGKIERDSALWCLGCNYTIIIASEDTDGKIKLRATTDVADKVLHESVPIYDFVS